jgi:sulfide dehydrogenase cytochrome subunit
MAKIERYVHRRRRHVHLSACVLLAISGLCTAAQAQSAGEQSADENVFDPGLTGVCTTCHGPRGESRGPATPTISGLSRNYLIGAMLSYKYANDLDTADDLVFENEDIEDVVVLARPTGIMNTVAEMLTLAEIKHIADYFSLQSFTPPVQDTNAESATAGAEIHQRYCGKCHEDGGASTADDVGLLAGQWKPYLTYLFEDLLSGDRQMPKKMATKLDLLQEDHGAEGIPQLIEYYSGSAKPGLGDGT